MTEYLIEIRDYENAEESAWRRYIGYYRGVDAAVLGAIRTDMFDMEGVRVPRPKKKNPWGNKKPYRSAARYSEKIGEAYEIRVTVRGHGSGRLTAGCKRVTDGT